MLFKARAFGILVCEDQSLDGVEHNGMNGIGI